MLHLGVSSRHTEDEVLWAIEDIIGPKELWPEWVRNQLFWETKMTDELCLKYILFSVGNLLPSHLIWQWLRVRRVQFNHYKFNDTLEKVKKAMVAESTKFFYWDINKGEYCFMNGPPRNNNANGVKPAKEVFQWAYYGLRA